MDNTISATEFKTNMGKYLQQIQDAEETFNITKNGKVIATIAPPEQENKLDKLLALQGIIPDNGQTKETIREERLSEQRESAV